MIGAWLGADADGAVCILDEAAVAEARELTRATGRAHGLVGERLERLVAAVSELATNQLRHAKGGLLAVRPCKRGAVPGLEVVAADRGEGLLDPARALMGAFERTAGSLGVGLSAVRRLVDELDIDIRRGEGMCFWARKFAEPVSRRHEVGIWADPKAGERTSGDDALFLRSEDGLLVAVIDGLGHGPRAREASQTIAEAIRSAPSLELLQMMQVLDLRARSTRGAAATVARIDELASAVVCAAVGNVTAGLHSAGGARRLSGSSWIVGGPPHISRAPRLQHVPFEKAAAFVIHSDGVSSSAAVDVSLLHDHPVVIARALAAQYGRATDDVTVLVVR